MFLIPSFGFFTIFYLAAVGEASMENVYDTALLAYSSGKICLKEFFEKAQPMIESYIHGKLTAKTCGAPKKSMEDFMLPLLGEQIDSEIFKKLSAVCRSNRLQVPGQPDPVNINVTRRKRTFEKVDIPKDVSLQTLKIRASRQKAPLRNLRYSPSIWLDHLMSQAWDVDAKKIDLIPGENLLVCLKIYNPFKHKVGEAMSRVPTPSQEIAVLGSNTLAEFRDKISCLSDNLVSRDISDNPSIALCEKAIDKYPSGMIYIGNDFYVDRRNPKSIDYSEVVKDWAAQRNIKLGKTFLMEETKFEDLSVRLGYPYLYQHQGNCEHLICFTDVRILHVSDPMQSSAYPLITCYFRRNVPHCMSCTNTAARWLTTNNTRLPHDPFYFCDGCFISFNYIDGKKIGEFKAYPFVSSDFDMEEPEEPEEPE